MWLNAYCILVILIPGTVQVKSDTSTLQLVSCFARVGHKFITKLGWLPRTIYVYFTFLLLCTKSEANNVDVIYTS